MKTVLITSSDFEIWERWGDKSWPSMKEAEDSDEPALEAYKHPSVDHQYFELVGEEYFSRFKKPYV